MSQTTLVPTNVYTVVDKDAHVIGELHAVKNLENWYTGHLKKLVLTESLQHLFSEIDKYVKTKDFALVRQLESEIHNHGLQIQETEQALGEVQLDKKGKIYFKIND